jgi:hypothetical protein
MKIEWEWVTPEHSVSELGTICEEDGPKPGFYWWEPGNAFPLGPFVSLEGTQRVAERFRKHEEALRHLEKHVCEER